jgi:hypothetical protein
LEIRLEGGIWPLRPEVCGILVGPQHRKTCRVFVALW